MKRDAKEVLRALLQSTRSIIVISGFFVLISAILIALLFNQKSNSISSIEDLDTVKLNSSPFSNFDEKGWQPPAENTIPANEYGELIKYGKELIAHTSVYLGPKGSVAMIANGMNCQNCHNDAGSKPFGINYAAVASTYPQFRPRANAIVSIEERINGCFQRSMNGQKLDSNTKEMKAMVAYMEWLGSEVPKGERPENAGIIKLDYLEIAADPKIGEAVYAKHCLSCHGGDGKGLLNSDGNEYIYPPLWGDDSYNDGAGLFRLRNFSGFVKYNMPLGVTINNTILSDEEAWHVAAYVNSQPRPHKDQSKDWPDIKLKSIDVPVGPYIDDFTEKQHKFGPFKPIEKAQKQTL